MDLPCAGYRGLRSGGHVRRCRAGGRRAGQCSNTGPVWGGTHKLNIRRGETALIHPVTVDVRVVQEGSGTLVTGGTPVHENGAAAEGQPAAAIHGGMTRPISPGDLVFIPAGVPHGIRDTDGITWLNIRFRIPQLDLSRPREPVSPGGGARAGTAVMDPRVFQSVDRTLSIGRSFSFNWS